MLCVLSSPSFLGLNPSSPTTLPTLELSDEIGLLVLRAEKELLGVVTGDKSFIG